MNIKEAKGMKEQFASKGNRNSLCNFAVSFEKPLKLHVVISRHKRSQIGTRLAAGSVLSSWRQTVTSFFG